MNSTATDAPNAGPPRLLVQVRDRLRFKHYSIRTEQAYLDWIRRFIRHYDRRHPVGMGAAEIEAFLTDLAVSRDVSASTQNQAKSAILFLYKEVLGVELPWLADVHSAGRRSGSRSCSLWRRSTISSGSFGASTS